MSKYVYQIFLAVLGAVIYRVRGGLAPALPRPFDQVLFALGYGAIVYKVTNNKIWFLIVLILTTLALMMGHGQYMDLAHYNLPVTPERLDFIVKIFFGTDNFNDYWRDFFGLALTGLVVSIPAGIVLFIYKQYIVGLLITISGLLKALAYAISWLLNYNTEGGELLTGLFLWGSIIIAWNFIKE